MNHSRLTDALDRVSARAASSVVARGRIASSALNSVLLRRLSAPPGAPESILADPVFESARAWRAADRNLGDLSGSILEPRLVDALDTAGSERMPRDRYPYAHQLDAWRAAADGVSFIVSSGTGSGKTECFMIPMLNEMLRDPAKGVLTGVRAIAIYPLNALIESQRARLSAWTATLKNRLSFALYNGMTPETPHKVETSKLGPAEVGDRRTIRERPPAILVTNVTMLEYLLLRSKDRNILERSQGLLRWIVLDEAHTYIGSQAAEMTLLLRRVRAAFGVEPENVQLLATSATVGEGPEAESTLKRFVAGMAGASENGVRVIEGHVTETALPSPGPDTPLVPNDLCRLDPAALWSALAPHPRVRSLAKAMSEGGMSLIRAAELLFGAAAVSRKADAQTILDLAALAERPASVGDESTTHRLLPWRAHIFHRALGGIWACVDPGCTHRDDELSAPDSDWPFGAVWLTPQDRCACGAIVFEVHVCNDCGSPHLAAGFRSDSLPRLAPLRENAPDDFAVDAEPEPEPSDGGDFAVDAEPEPKPSNGQDGDGSDTIANDRVILSPPRGDSSDGFVNVDDGAFFDNDPPSRGVRWTRVALHDDERLRRCCPTAANARLVPQRYGPPFFMGASMPDILTMLATPGDRPGLPAGGRRCLTFSDSRQGTARLAAKLQQDAERSLTRSFLYHAVQNDGNSETSTQSELLEKLEIFKSKPDLFADAIRRIEEQLVGKPSSIAWTDLVTRFSNHPELRSFAIQAWRERASGGHELAEDPRNLAEMFLYRELFRRPKVQNNVETMGLVRLSFPDLEAKAITHCPKPLAEKSIPDSDWTALALAAVDFVFRDALATDIADQQMARFVSPRGGSLRSICRSGLQPHERPAGSQSWPGPVPASGRPSRLHRLLYASLAGHWDNPADRDRAAEALSALWHLIVTTAAKDIGGGAYRLDFARRAAVSRLGNGWLCPVTRRIFGYSVGQRSPYDEKAVMESITMPRLPVANGGGLELSDRERVVDWAQTDAIIAELRTMGLWTDLHDRAASYAPFVRAQEHSAQIDRRVLALYEDDFRDGKINLLNCSTTMEMGIDIPHIRLVANANVPPSISNYRQRVGRAGRRGEPWSFGITFCRDLPLDRTVFADSLRFLQRTAAVPSINLDSERLALRHVHAALLGAYLRERAEGFNVRASIGAFFGAPESSSQKAESFISGNDFIRALRGPLAEDEDIAADLAHLVRDTVLEYRDPTYLTSETAQAFELTMRAWRTEYLDLLQRQEGAIENEVKQAFATRARRMKGEFLLGELARRGFTPSYGFPVDVVSFDHLSGHRRQDGYEGAFVFGEHRGGASRTLDVAIREYAPGAEVVVNGLVHLSEGVLPAWGTEADASKLEDFRQFWDCTSCHGFGLSRILKATCSICSAPNPRWYRCLRPAGFLGRKAPHTGYENLGYVPYEMARISAGNAPWRALPDPAAGRLRASPDGQVVTLSAGANGHGYAICLDCGRAEAEIHEGAVGGLPAAIRRHKPLAKARGALLATGYCRGGAVDPQRIQRNVRLVHDTCTDVFELQLPAIAERSEGFALAAGLREALASRLGTEAREIGVAVQRSGGSDAPPPLTAVLYDRAPGGAGLASRLADEQRFSEYLDDAIEKLTCPEACANGCPACVLRPDLSYGDRCLDRRGGLELAKTIRNRLGLPEALRIFGSQTHMLGLPLTEWLNQQFSLPVGPTGMTLYLHGAPSDWDLTQWPMGKIISRIDDSGLQPMLVLAKEALTHRMFTLATKLDLHRLSAHAKVGYAEELPVIDGALVIAEMQYADRIECIATRETAESVPGHEWGLGAKAPIMIGPAEKRLEANSFDSKELIALSGGNAMTIRVGKRLDGSAAGFGRAFWRVLAKEAPLWIAGIADGKVVKMEYTDRYLRSPLPLRLLFEVIRAAPNAKTAQVYVTTARLGPPDRQGWAIFHDFVDEQTRRAAMEALMPAAKIDVFDRIQLPHERCLTLRSADGREVKVTLDQGFGSWRTNGAPAFDFGATPECQARFLKAAELSISIAKGQEALIIVEGGVDDVD